MRLLLQSCHQRSPVANAVTHGSQQIHMRRRSQQAILQVLPKSVVNREGNDQRRNSGGHAGDGDSRDHANDGLLALSTQIARRDEEFETHREAAVSEFHNTFGSIPTRKAAGGPPWVTLDASFA